MVKVQARSCTGQGADQDGLQLSNPVILMILRLEVNKADHFTQEKASREP